MTTLENSNDMVNTLMARDEIFRQYFENHLTEPNLSNDDFEKGKKKFKEFFPSYPDELPVFRCRWVLDKINQCQINAENIENDPPLEECRNHIFDSAKNKFVRPQVLPPAKRRRSPKFNVGEFIRQKRLDGDYFEVCLQDRDMVEDLLEELSENKSRNDRKADTVLNSLAAMATALTGGLSYRLVELHPERRIL